MDPITFKSASAAIDSFASAGNAANRASNSSPTGFGAALKQALDKVNASQVEGERLAREFQLENPAVSLEEAMIAAQKASIEFQAALQVRNKLVSAYHDIMNMPV